jgi:Chlorite dismutase
MSDPLSARPAVPASSTAAAAEILGVGHSAEPAAEPAKLPGLPPIDLHEYGGKRDGVRQALNRRLFFQLLVLDAPAGMDAEALGTELATALRDRNVPSVLYRDANHPRGIGLLTWSEDPEHFVTVVRPLFGLPLARAAIIRDDFTMLGRTYSTGHEPDLEHVLLRRPVGNVLHAEYKWHVWYPLRRNGAFTKLEPVEQSHIMREHASIGFAYGQPGYAHDVRLACHGLDAADNEFVIGIVSSTLHPISHLVQTMRKTRQTSEFIVQMGPFFVGHVLQQHGIAPAASAH